MISIKSFFATLALTVLLTGMAVAAPVEPTENMSIEERSANITARQELVYGFLMMSGTNCATPEGKADVSVRNNDGNNWIPGACYPLTGGLKIRSGLSWASNPSYRIDLYTDQYCQQTRWSIPGEGGCRTGVPAGWFDIRVRITFFITFPGNTDETSRSSKITEHTSGHIIAEKGL